jgi:deazaflavin-dependent oxidoreductase (nitroreductase family)
MTLLISLLAALFVGLLGLLALFLGGMHFKWTLVVDAVRGANMRFFNPRQMQTAGTPGAYAGILKHVGRISGTRYQTPLGIEPIGDGFLIALIYGERTQWLKNVLAAGSAEVVVEGVAYAVDRPELVPMTEVVNDLPPGDRRLMSLFGVGQALRLHRVGVVEPGRNGGSSHE